MGTRAVITFKDSTGSYSVYQHWDGDPETVLEDIKWGDNTWKWPRWEADEFAAAYVARVKKGEGNIRISKGPRMHPDADYRYTVIRSANGLKVTYVRVGTRQYRIKYVFPERIMDLGIKL